MLFPVSTHDIEHLIHQGGYTRFSREKSYLPYIDLPPEGAHNVMYASYLHELLATILDVAMI